MRREVTFPQLSLRLPGMIVNELDLQSSPAVLPARHFEKLLFHLWAGLCTPIHLGTLSMYSR